MVRAYCRGGGLRSFLVPDYFEGTRFRLGAFEPFNEVELYLKESGGALKAEDLIRVKNRAREISKDFARYLFLSKVASGILKFVRLPDEEVYKVLKDALEVRGFYPFNLVRFWLRLASVLGFSPDRLTRAGWVNAYDLGACSEEDARRGYCIFVHPRVLVTLKRAGAPDAKPFEIDPKTLEAVEKFFSRFFSLQTENF